MAKKKISQFTEAATLEDTDILPVVINPATIPASRKLTTANLRMSLLGNASAVTTLAEDVGVALADGTQITLEDLRNSILPAKCSYVPPSGDATGVTDTAAIQAAITAGYVTAAAYLPATSTTQILLSGHYYITGPLQNGLESNTSDDLANPVAIIGVPHACIERVGDAADDYMLRMFGVTRASKLAITRLANLSFKCAYKCRGIMVTGFHQYPRFENIYVYQSMKVGIDIIDCYTSSWNNIHVYWARGYGLRTDSFNSAQLSNCRIANCYGMYHADEAGQPSTLTSALVDYAMVNGDATAETYYTSGEGGPDNWAESWPADDDDVPVNESGTAFNLTNAAGTMGHSALCMDGNCFLVNNLAFEVCCTVEDPIYFLAGASSQTNMIRFESCKASVAKIRLAGLSGYTARGKNNTLSGIYVRDGYAEDDVCDSIIEATTSTYNNTINGVSAQGIETAILTHNGGTHFDNTVQNNWYAYPVTNPVVARQETNGATYNFVADGRQESPAEIADGNTAITAANLQSRVLFMASTTTGRAPTVPTGTAVYGVIHVNECIDWSFLNTGDQTVTITANADHTLVGNMVIAAGTQKSFRTRCSAENTAITYALT